MNSFRTREDTLARPGVVRRPRGRRPAARLPAEQGAEAPRRRPHPGRAGRPTRALEWCPPGHGDLYTALRGTGPPRRDARRRVHARRSSRTPTTSARCRTRGSPAGSPRAARRSRSRRSAGRRATARAATSRGGRATAGSCCARPRRRCPRTRRRSPTSTGTGSPRPTTSGSTCGRCRTELDERDGILGLAMIRNVKTVDPADSDSPEVIQIETAMGAAIEVFEGARTIEVGRDRFVPVKTTNDLLVLRSDCYELDDDAVLHQVPAERAVRGPRQALQAGRRVRGAVPRRRRRASRRPRSFVVARRLDLRRGRHRRRRRRGGGARLARARWSRHAPG